MIFMFLPSEWNVTNLGDVAEVLDPQPDHRTPPEVLDGIPYIGVNDFLTNGELDIKSCRKVSGEVWAKQQADILISDGGIIFGKIGTIGFPKLLPKNSTKYALSANVVLIKPRINTLFVLYWLESNYIARQIYRTLHTTSQPALGIIKIRQLMIAAPPSSEQQKIAEILGTWDKAIALLEKLITVKRKLKQGLMQQLLTGKKRFREFIQSEQRQETRYSSLPYDWKYMPIGEVAKEYSQKNKEAKNITVLSCSKYKGLVNSLEYFGKQVFSEDTSTYKIVKRAMFAYATNHIDEGSIGYQNLCDEALISPMYTVFKTDSNQIYDLFLYSVLKTEHYRQIFSINTSASVERRGSLRWNEFTKIKIPLPPLREQQKIASLLSTADTEISNLEKQLAAYKQQKRGLMQQLLTGKKRVKLEESLRQEV